MAYLRPNLETRRQQILSSVQTSGLPGASNGFLRTSIFGALIWALAKVVNIVYGYLDYISLQSVPYTATGVFLEAWAAFKGRLRQPAQAATGNIQLITSADGLIVNQGISITRNVDGFTYNTVGNAVSFNSLVNISFQASTVGSAGNAPLGTPMTLQGSIAGITQTGNSSVITGGTDIQTDDSLRSDMIEDFSAPAQGGASTDYVGWGLDVNGCTRAWCNPNGMGIGTVVVYPMFDNADAAFSGFPQGNAGVSTSETRGGNIFATGDLAAVANFIYNVRPCTAIVWAIAPVPFAVNVSITSLTTNTPAIQSAIVNAITDTFVEIGSPLGSQVYPSDIATAIESVPGIGRYILSSPNSIVSIPVGYLPVLPANIVINGSNVAT